MAMTLTTTDFTVFGNKRAVVGYVTMASTSTTGTVITGLRKIDAACVTPVSGATAVFSIHKNLGSAGTAINGEFGITSALSSNIFDVVIFGD